MVKENNLYKVKDQLIEELTNMDPSDPTYQAKLNQLLTIDRQIAEYEKRQAELEKASIEARSRKAEAVLKIVGTILGSVVIVVGGCFANMVTMDHMTAIEEGGSYVTQTVKSALQFFKPKV